jgi:hypothetical protein
LDDDRIHVAVISGKFEKNASIPNPKRNSTIPTGMDNASSARRPAETKGSLRPVRSAKAPMMLSVSAARRFDQ